VWWRTFGDLTKVCSALVVWTQTGQHQPLQFRLSTAQLPAPVRKNSFSHSGDLINFADEVKRLGL
jgi:hypothetical protein